MAHHIRAGIAAAFIFSSLASATVLLLNPRFVGHLPLGVLVFLAIPLVAGTVGGIGFGRVLENLARIGSSEDTRRAYRLLWASLLSLSVFLTTVTLFPPFLGVFTDSEIIRYGGALLLAAGLGGLAGLVVHETARSGAPWLWPLLLALPCAVVVSGGTDWGRGQGKGSRVLVLAFPGFSWNVAEELLEKKQLPHLDALRRSGAWGSVQSVKPLMEPVVWTSIATGKLSPEHGVQGFSATASDVRVKRVWDIFAEKGWSVGLFGWPVTWPPPEGLNGFVVPSISDLGTDARPAQLGFIRELAMSEKTRRPRTWGRYWRYAFLGIRYGARLETLINSGRTILTEALRGKDLDAAELFSKRVLRAQLSCDHFMDLRRKRSPDFAAYHTNIVQVAQSHFWKYYEPASFSDVSRDEVDRYGSSVEDAYRIVDEFVGRILEDVDGDELVVIVSDHGAEAVTEAAATTYSLRVEPLLEKMRLKNVCEATTVGARTFVRMKPGHEGDLNRVQRLFDTARLGDANAPAFQARVDEWRNLVVSVEALANERPDDTILFQGGRCPVSEVVRAVELQESSQMDETGALVLSGKGVVRGGRIAASSLLDLVPTLLALTDCPLAADMPGNVIESALAEPLNEKLPSFVASYEPGVSTELPALSEPAPSPESVPEISPGG